MQSTSIPCYRLLGSQRIDGLLTLRKDAIHFEADFPSRHRLYLPIHQLLGLHHETDPVPIIRTLSEFGSVAFYPIRSNSDTTDESNLVRLIRKRFEPSRTPLFSIQHPAIQECSDTNPLHSYLEGQYSINGATFTACAVQIYQETIHILARDHDNTELHIKELTSASCNRSWLSNRIETHLEFSGKTVCFRGSHSIHLWALMDCLSNDSVLLHSWNDKRHWWQGPCTVTLLSTGIRWYSIDLFKAKGQYQEIDWTSIQSIDFSGRTLSIHTEQGEVSLGQRHRTTFYKNIVEQMLEAMCHNFESRLVGLWDEERKVHMGTLTLSGDLLTFVPKDSSLSVIKYRLQDLWMPELFDSSKAFIQIRIPGTDPTPKWIVIHCGNSSIAQNWVSVLNLPSKRLLWNNLTVNDKTELFTQRIGMLHHPNHSLINIQFNYLNDTLTLISEVEVLPVDSPVEIWFNNGQRKFRMHAQIEYRQDIPVTQWILQRPKQLDIYNFRAHHRTQVELDAHLIPIRWEIEGGWMPDLTASLPVTVKDLSYTGCALEIDSELEICQFWLLQVPLPTHTAQLIGQIRYQRQQATLLWRVGFQFTSRRSQLIRDMLSNITEEDTLQVPSN